MFDQAPPTGIYGWIQSNDGRSAGLFVAFLVAVQLLGAVVLCLPITLIDPGHAPFLSWLGYLVRYAPIVLLASIIWFAWQLLLHIETIRKSVGFRFVDGTEEPRLCRVIEPLIVTMGLPAPFIGLIDSPARNAFACGLGPKKAVIVVTRALIDDLDNEELAAVLAHELSHIKHGDIRLMAAANVLMRALERMHESNPMRFTPVHVVLSIAVPAMLPLSVLGGFLAHVALRGGQVVRLIISTSREYIADAEAAQLTKNPGALAAALLKVEHNYQITGARPEDDAMMIAGDTIGTSATHPTVPQRIAALARVTGSMVFNSPDSPSQAAWNGSATLAQAKTAALTGRLPAAQMLARIRAGAAENWLGLSKWGTFSVCATLLALAIIHRGDLNNPHAIAAKFDVRPIGLLLAIPSFCQYQQTQNVDFECNEHHGMNAYRDFEGQKNTLAGLLADMHRQQREQSGMTAIAPPASDQSDFHEKGFIATTAPMAQQIADVEKRGCFPADLVHGDHPEGLPLEPNEPSPDVSLAQYLSDAEVSRVSSGDPGTPDHDQWLRDYTQRRMSTLTAAYDRLGMSGLDQVAQTYQAAGHQRIVDQIGHRLADPQFSRQLPALERSELQALARASDNVLPCVALRHRRSPASVNRPA